VYDGVAADDAGSLEVRVGLYRLLAHMLARPPSAEFLDRLASLRGDGTPIGRELGDLAGLAGRRDAQGVEREYNALFIGVDRGELVPYASFYLTGFLHDRPLARLRRDMATMGLERLAGISEPEDHIASLCEIMGGLVAGQYQAAPGLPEGRFFARYLAPWAGQFFSDLERSSSADLYRPVGRLGQLLVEIEAECLSEGISA
jgi:TorA maturation chaperone TorD